MAAAGCSSAETTWMSTHNTEVPLTSYTPRYIDSSTPSFKARRTDSLRHGMLRIIMVGADSPTTCVCPFLYMYELDGNTCRGRQRLAIDPSSCPPGSRALSDRPASLSSTPLLYTVVLKARPLAMPCANLPTPFWQRAEGVILPGWSACLAPAGLCIGAGCARSPIV